MVKKVIMLSLSMLVLFEWRGFLSDSCWGAGVFCRASPLGKAPTTTGPGASSAPPQDCTLDTGQEPAEEDDLLDVAIEHGVFETDSLVPGIIYQVLVTRNDPKSSKDVPSSTAEDAAIDLTLSSKTDDGAPLGKFLTPSTGDAAPCGDAHVFRAQLTATSEPPKINWTIDNQERFRSEENVTFRIHFRVSGKPPVFGTSSRTLPISRDCQLRLRQEEGAISSSDAPRSRDCQIWFPSHGAGRSLVLEVMRLNVPCSRGHIHFSGLNVTQHQPFRSHGQTHLCGKLEELSKSDRHMYFPFSHTPPVMQLHGAPVFAVAYHLVDYCYNVTSTTRNGSFELTSTRDLQCTFKIFLPYGNRVALTLDFGTSSGSSAEAGGGSESESDEDLQNSILEGPETQCRGLQTQLVDGGNRWSHCTAPGDAAKQIEIVSRENKVMLQVSNLARPEGRDFEMRISYKAVPVEAVVGDCDFGWVALQQFCVAAVEESRLPWAQAEIECVRRGGHLASIRNEHVQKVINKMLINSPGYRDDNAYWIGASDKVLEGDFRWTDGFPFSYTYWFQGWPQYSHYNRQPNDDGLSEQDCIELRRTFTLPSSAASLNQNFMWNDRDCATPNFLICEKLQSNEFIEESWPSECNKTVELSRQQSRASVYSPGFPRQYPDNAFCTIDVTAPSGYRLILDFEELVLENESTCSYDYLEISESVHNGTNSTFNKRLCGDWSSKLKLLRYVSNGPKLQLKFSSDYSHHFGGYKARVSMEHGNHCADDRLVMFNNSCYLFVSYPEVTWETARQICTGKNSKLASIVSAEEGRFVTTNIRKTAEYRTDNALYWIGAKFADSSREMKWLDGSPIGYSDWMSEEDRPSNVTEFFAEECLALQWTPSPTPLYPSGMYWKLQKCDTIGGYVCKRPHQLADGTINFSRSVNGSSGQLSSPGYPESYFNNLDYLVRIVGPERTRIVIKFDKIDVEPQFECLYDYLELVRSKNSSVRLCGRHDHDMQRFNFVSEDNEVTLKFHSDYSNSGKGFALSWEAVDVSACPMQTLRAKEGTLNSPNYPDFLLNSLDCTFTILAPPKKRIWLEFQDYNIENLNDSRTMLQLALGPQVAPLQPYGSPHLITESSYVSSGVKLEIKLLTGHNTTYGRGFKANYKIIGSPAAEEKIISLNWNSSGPLHHLNYPSSPATNVDFLQHLIAPIGHTITVDLFGVKFITDKGCKDKSSVLEIYDNYYHNNDTSWKLCPDDTENSVPLSITSFLNTLHLRQKNGNVGVVVNGSLRVQVDEEFKLKLLKYEPGEIKSCNPNPCHNEGKCTTKGEQKFCQCSGHFTGIFCALTKCELEPCVFGTCHLTNTSYRCKCRSGYVGANCDQKKKPCAGNPCENRGVCFEKGDGFFCQCHAWWEGPRCEKRMLHIPYKPLSERMFHEPFWLGLMTVFVVMSVIGLVWCAKRHFPEKIEKLLAEDGDRSRSTSLSLRNSSVREQLAAAAASGGPPMLVTPSPGPITPRSLFGRLGIRKPSLLSLTSPHASGGGYAPATARTFSLDDLLKPPQMRTPSPKKKRNNSTPTKKNAAEKKQILQQLISQGGKQVSRKVSLTELIQMSERHKDNQEEVKVSPDTVQAVFNDPKLEKKVTFARLLNKVSAEMSSSSEIELSIMQSGKLGCVFARPFSTPPSPNIEARSPNSTSSNQGSTSQSLNGSDSAIPTALSTSISDLLGRGKPGRLVKQKPSSADSILAMFKSFSASNSGANLRITPSTTPTLSTPQDDYVDDESCSSSLHTPVSLSSGPPESPILHRQSHNTIEVPVLDALNANRSGSSSSNSSSSSSSNFLHPPTILLEIPSTISKCLSPIRELPTPLPTPLPSPALTPIMRRSAASSSTDDVEIAEELRNIPMSDGEEDEELVCTQDIIAIDPQGEDGLILEEVAAMKPKLVRTKNRPPPLGELPQASASQPPPLVIPTLTIQTPSPTQRRCPSIIFPGSPPPQRGLAPKRPTKCADKPKTLDILCHHAPPTITINRSETESDAESSASPRPPGVHLGPAPGGMTYLSPFSIASRDHTASESNLSSSGYSSMASPGPSRCGSSNPLCPSEIDDPMHPGHSGMRKNSSPILKMRNSPTVQVQLRRRSDSETLSDDPVLESNDEGIGTDHLEEKIDDGNLKSPKELEVFIMGEVEAPTKMERLLPPPANSKTYQVPSIVVEGEAASSSECQHLSPMSSRSESPLSDRTTGLGRFSPQFYGRHKDALPFTDSDGLYDFPSSDKVNVLSTTGHKKMSRKRDKKSMRNCKTPSPTKTTNPLLFNCHLHVPSKEAFHKVPLPRKLSPKRKSIRPQLNSSSSSDSLTSPCELRLSSASLSPNTVLCASPAELDDSCFDANTAMLPKTEVIPRRQKISRLRTISHQIRFLRRLELSLKRRERTTSPTNSDEGNGGYDDDDDDEDIDSPRATSPLLQPSKGSKEDCIRKSSSNSLLQGGRRAKNKKDKMGIASY